VEIRATERACQTGTIIKFRTLFTNRHIDKQINKSTTLNNRQSTGDPDGRAYKMTKMRRN